jgi:ATPase subunit of ABC transporter with duplicated ATPase domains
MNISYRSNKKNKISSDNISLEGITISIDNKILLNDSVLNISKNNIIGLIGKNGCGKTTILKTIAGKFDKKLPINNSWFIWYVEQEIEDTEINPIQFILKSNVRLTKIVDKVKNLEVKMENDDISNEEMEEYDNLQNKLNEFELNKQEPKIRKILNGLGFSDIEMTQPCNTFSGGWRMRISLATALYMKPDILLLDEPTNHLDLPAVIWLGNYLSDWENTAIVVSHNVGFLNDICTHIWNIENNKIVTYKGDYYNFRKNNESKKVKIEKDYKKFKNKLKKLKNGKNKKSKKEIEEFIKNEEPEKPNLDYKVKLSLEEVYKYDKNIIEADNISFGYDDENIINNLTFGMNMDSRIVLVGNNGSGKSTIIKLIMNLIQPKSGEIKINSKVRIGYYDQHFENCLPFDETPLEYLLKYVDNDKYEKRPEQVVRGLLGQMKLDGKAHVQKIRGLSGGQKARVALVKLILQAPHFILLDEPTNHLDLETIDALISCLENYNGGLLLITHEAELIKRINARLWILKNKKLYFKNNFNNYVKNIINSLE